VECNKEQQHTRFYWHAAAAVQHVQQGVTEAQRGQAAAAAVAEGRGGRQQGASAKGSCAAADVVHMA